MAEAKLSWEEYNIQESAKEAARDKERGRRAAWITFAAARQGDMMVDPEARTVAVDVRAQYAAAEADAMLLELDKRDFSGGG